MLIQFGDFKDNFYKNNSHIYPYNHDVINKNEYQYVTPKVDAFIENFIGTEKEIKAERCRLSIQFKEEYSKKCNENKQFHNKVQEAFILAVSQEFKNQQKAKKMFEKFISIFSEMSHNEIVDILFQFKDIIDD